jgi:hypothetical protein
MDVKFGGCGLSGQLSQARPEFLLLLYVDVLIGEEYDPTV